MRTRSVFRGAYYRSLDDATRRVASAPREEVLEPDLAIIDPHHHLMDSVRGRYLAPDYLADIAEGHDIRQSVFINSATGYRTDGSEILRPVGEVEFASSVASQHPDAPRLCAGIVGPADLCRGDAIAELLDAEIAADSARFKGVRDLVQWDGTIVGQYSTRRAPQGKLLDSNFRAGFRHLASRGLSFDAWLFHPQLPELIDLADAFPGTSIILDHAGTPLGAGPYAAVRNSVFRAWRGSLAELAKRSNVSVKIGGFGMPYCGFEFLFPERPPASAPLAQAWRPYIESVIELFGASRAMFESNFPADKQTCGFGVLWNAFKRVTQGFSADEKSALFRETARRVYRLA